MSILSLAKSGSKNEGYVRMSTGSQLNDKQYEAMKYVQGPLLVLAGAGSGKTSVITKKLPIW